MSGMNIPWGMANQAASPMQRTLQGFQLGQQERRKMDMERALGALGPGLDNSEALSSLYALDPQLAAGIENAAHQRGERSRAAASRSALGDYYKAGLPGAPVTGPSPEQPLSLATGGTAAAASSGAIAALAGTPQAPALSDVSPSTLAAPAQAAPAMAAPATSPEAQRRAALERLAEANPEMAFKLQEQETATKLKRFEHVQKINEFGIQLLGGVTDQASYDAAAQRYNGMLQQLGYPPAQLPPTYSPEVVRRLQLSILSVKEQMDALKPVTVSPGTAVLDPLTLKEKYRNPVAPRFMRVTGPDGNDTIVEVGGDDDEPAPGAGVGAPSGGAFRVVGLPGDQETSGYRTPERNAQVGGVPDSFHTRRDAAGNPLASDRVPPAGMSMASYAAELQRRNPNLEVINEGDHVHLEPRSRGQFAAGGGAPGGARTVYTGGKKPTKAGKPQYEYKMIGGKLMKRRVG